MLKTMSRFVQQILPQSSSLRRRPRQSISLDCQNLETRQLLAAHVLHAAGHPSAAAVSVERSSAPAAPADFSGDWDVTTSQFNAKVIISQQGKTATAKITIEDLPQVSVNAKIKGDAFTARGTFALPIPGFGNITAKVKLTGIKDGADAFHGTIAGKGAGQKFNIAFTAALKL